MKGILITLILALPFFQGAELKIVQSVEPVYPLAARAARARPSVNVSVNVNPDGSVQSVTVVDGHPLLDEAAIEAVRKWKFTVTTLGGVVDVTVPFAQAAPVTGSITGRVVNPEGRPIAGVRINTRSIAYRSGKRAWNQGLADGNTDADGNYTVSVTDPGEYYVIAFYSVPANAPAGSADNYSPQTYYPGTSDASAAVPVTVRLESTAIADIRIPRMDTVSVSGKVLVPPLQEPARGPVDIRLVRIDPQFADEAVAGQFPALEGRTEIPFDLRGIRPGLYEISVSLGTGPPNWAYSGHLAIDVRERNVENLTVVLHRNIEFKGRVVSTDPSVQLQGVSLNSRDGIGGGSFQVEPDGSVRLFNMPESNYNVGLLGLLGGAYVSDLRLGASSIYTEGIVPITDRPPEDLQIILATNGGTVAGTVQGRLQQGAIAQVMLVPDGSRRKNLLFYKEVKSNASGEFEFIALPPGDYKVFAFEDPPPEGAIENAEFVAQYEQRGVRVTVREGAVMNGVFVPLISKP